MPYDTNSVQIFASVMRVALRRGIPTGKSPGFPFPAQNADHFSPQLEQSPSSGAESQPAAGQVPKAVAMGKQGDIPRFRNRQHPVDGLFTAPLHLVHLLPIWTTMGPDAPSGLPMPDLSHGWGQDGVIDEE